MKTGILPIHEVKGLLLGLAVGGALMSAGLWLFYRGILRARYLVQICFPAALVLMLFVAMIWNPIPLTWGAKLLASFIGAALVMIPALVILRIKGADFDEWDRRRGK